MPCVCLPLSWIEHWLRVVGLAGVVVVVGSKLCIVVDLTGWLFCVCLCECVG